MIEIPAPSEISNILEYIQKWEEVREEVNFILKSIPIENFTKKPEKNGWSASEIAEHLYLSQNLFALFLPKVLSGKKGYSKEKLKTINYKEIEKKLKKPFSGIKNPDVVTPKNQWDQKTAIANLNRAMMNLKKSLDGYDLLLLKERGMMHGIFGPISILDYIYILIIHEIGHLESLKIKFG